VGDRQSRIQTRQETGILKDMQDRRQAVWETGKMRDGQGGIQAGQETGSLEDKQDMRQPVW
jgi:hypothetical protein